MEKVAAFGGITFYDDSKGTNVGATVAALSGMMQSVVLIAGGDGKGQDFSPLAAPIARQARAVVLMGRDADKIGAAINHCGVPLYYVKTMEEAVQRSFELARAGDAVLMSPACASLDMFRNYAHRAEVFIAAVRRIEAGRQATANHNRQLMIYQYDIRGKKNLPDFDQSLIWSSILLLSLGLVMVYSASISIAEAGRGTNGHPAHFLARHGAYLAVGLLTGLVAFQVPMRLWQKYSFPLFFLGVVLLTLVLIPAIGHEVNGSRRWISLWIVNLQPSEFMKLFIVFYVANYTVRKAHQLGSFRKGFLPMLIVVLIVGAVAAARAGLWLIRRYYRHYDGHIVFGRDGPEAVRGADRLFGCGTAGSHLD